jgi:paired amphipathic helix protein Sin3a
VHHEVTRLFRHRAPDLLEEFRVFLPAQGDGGLIGLAQVGGSNTTGDNDRRKRSVYQDGQRRKRKAAEKETQREFGSKLSPPLKVNSVATSIFSVIEAL